MNRIILTCTLCILTFVPISAFAQSTVTLPDTSQSSTLTASVSEQCRITVPSTITFNVTDISANTNATASVTITNIVLSAATKSLKLSLQAGAASFTPPVGGATTWAAGDVTWAAGTWTNGTGQAGTLSNSAYVEVATSDADAASMSNASLTFTLAAKTSVKRSGSHTLSVTWKVESL
jgi:hypothetical protein